MVWTGPSDASAPPTTGAKEQPWKKLWPPQPAGGEKGGNSTPWATWKPNADEPDEKPWIKWMNDAEFNPKLASPETKSPSAPRGRASEVEGFVPKARDVSPKTTVAEGG